MSCKRFHELISAEIDGELAGRESDELKAHLHHCKECASLRREFASTRGMLREWRVDPPAFQVEPEQRNANGAVREFLRFLLRGHLRVPVPIVVSCVVLLLAMIVARLEPEEDPSFEPASRSSVVIATLDERSELFVLRGNYDRMRPEGHWKKGGGSP